MAARWFRGVLLGLLGLLAGCATPAPPQSGILWLDHTSLDTDPNGALWTDVSGSGDLIVRPKLGRNGGAAFLEMPVGAVGPVAATGLRVCYGLDGDGPGTGIRELRLAQFDEESGLSAGGGVWPGYVVVLRDALPADVLPMPEGGWRLGNAASFLCLDSQETACAALAAGTLMAGLQVQLGDANDAIRIRALGLRYERGC